MRAVPGAWRWVAVAASVLLVLVSAAWAYTAVVDTQRADEATAEVGFARDMTAHHEQGITLSFLVRDLTDDDVVRTFARDVLQAQAQEQGWMQGWLRRNAVPATSAQPPMAWMDEPLTTGDGGHHGGGAGPVEHDMGLATDEQLLELGALQGTEAAVMFLQLMHRHHEGAITMVDGYLARSTDDDLRGLAEGMRTAQQREITVLDDLLAERGATA